MCCHRRRRGPIVVVLGKLAYDKYQSHKADKRARALSDPNNTFIDNSTLPDKANREILENSGLQPPSYDELMGNQSMESSKTRKDEKSGWVEVSGEEGSDDRDDLSDAESFYEVVDGMRSPNKEMDKAQKSFVESWKAKRAS